jgi:phosphohistidine swiveling domain-containing protein
LSQGDDIPVFPILRGESVGEAGEFSGHVVLIENPDAMNREWSSDSIAVLHHDLEHHFINNPGDLDNLMSEVSAVVAEFGDSVSEFAAAAYHREAIAIVKVADACHVLEDGMHIRILAHENIGDVFFID